MIIKAIYEKEIKTDTLAYDILIPKNPIICFSNIKKPHDTREFTITQNDVKEKDFQAATSYLCNTIQENNLEPKYVPL